MTHRPPTSRGQRHLFRRAWWPLYPLSCFAVLFVFPVAGIACGAGRFQSFGLRVVTLIAMAALGCVVGDSLLRFLGTQFYDGGVRLLSIFGSRYIHWAHVGEVEWDARYGWLTLITERERLSINLSPFQSPDEILRWARSKLAELDPRWDAWEPLPYGTAPPRDKTGQ